MKIVCVGRNYVAHARELGNEVPSDPVIFIKPATALSSPDNPFSIPSFSNEIHYECELVLRIAKPVRQLKKEETLSCVDAITAGIDFTARDLQQQLKEKGLPWEKAKAFDGAALFSGFVALPEDSGQLSLRLHVDGELRQAGGVGGGAGAAARGF